MRRLNLPSITSVDAYSICLSSVTDVELKARLTDISTDIEASSAEYVYQASISSIYTIAPLNHARGVDPVVVGHVLKSELVDLYDCHMVQKKPGRRIYDAILVSANEKCPFCGGIGRPKSLDHYLPKSKYPQFSVLPQNLIPSCRDCNTGKGSVLAQAADQQPIHPYFDSDCFFLEQWVYARVLYTSPCTLEFFTSIPDGWSELNFLRVVNHFKDFDLAKRFSIQAAEELSTIIDQRKGYLNNATPVEFANYLRSVAGSSALFINHWRKVMYQTLAADEWFCTHAF